MQDKIVKLVLGKNKNINDKNARNICGTRAGIIGILCNLILCAFKIIVGAASASISIVADGLNNLSDMGSSVITMIGFKIAGKPADKDHPYGHGRMEYMSAFIVAMLILLVGVELFKESVSALISGEKLPRYGTVAIVVLCVSVVLKFLMYLFNKILGKAINSETLSATAQDSVNDSITTLVILISVSVSKIFDLSFNLDAVMGVAVSIFILYSGFKAAKETTDVILGTPPSKELIEEIRDCILSFDTFLGIHDLIIHSYGPNREFASVHVEVPQDINIVECHEKIDICEKLVYEKCGVELVIHMDPIETDNEEINRAKAMISAGLKQIHPKLSLHDFRMTPKGDKRTNFIFDVVVPADLGLTGTQLKVKIDEIAKSIDPSYYCVVTLDNDYACM